MPPTTSTSVVDKLMSNLLPRLTSNKSTRTPVVPASNRVSFCRETLRNINWKLIVFCVALWWFIYSAPTEGILSPHFWASSTATNSDDF